MNNTDAIRELTKTLTQLEERLENNREEINRLNFERTKMADLPAGIDKRPAILEEKLAEQKRVMDEKERRRWAVVLALTGSLIGSFFTPAINIALLFLKK